MSKNDVGVREFRAALRVRRVGDEGVRAGRENGAAEFALAVRHGFGAARGAVVERDFSRGESGVASICARR